MRLGSEIERKTARIMHEISILRAMLFKVISYKAEKGGLNRRRMQRENFSGEIYLFIYLK